MKDDLLAQIGVAKGATHAVVLTHNIDLLFVESVVLTSLKRCGSPSLTILADAGCCAETFERQRPFVHALGRRYRLVPVAMDAGFRFHPKAVLLAGPSTARLWVGSGNLTFGGWRENAEVWVGFTVETDGAGVFASFRDYLLRILQRVPLPDPLVAQVGTIFEASKHAWWDPGAAQQHLVGRAAVGEPALLDLMSQRVPPPLQRIELVAPYFDEKLRAVSVLADRAPLTVNVQAARVPLPRAPYDRLRHDVAFQCVRPARTGEESKKEGDPFIHAKAYAFESLGGSRGFVGSANCSFAALLATGSRGNAELMVDVGDVTTGELFSELVRVSDPPTIVDEIEGPEDPLDGPAELPIAVLVARLDMGRLTIAFRCAPGVVVEQLRVDDVLVAYERRSGNQLHARVASVASRVELIGHTADANVCRATSWVDNERFLSASARGRELLDRVRKHEMRGVWSFDAWADVMAAFCEHIEDLPAGVQPERANVKEGAAQTFDAAAAFARVARLPAMPPTRGLDGVLDLRGSLHAALMRWFENYSDGSDAPVEGPPGDDAARATGDKGNRSLSEQPEPQQREPPTAREARRVLALVDRVITKLSDERYLQLREAVHLGADLGIASTLLRVARRHAWIDAKKFFDGTAAIWSRLFLSSKGSPTRGWIERRHESDADPEKFRADMSSPRLAAALAAWVLAAPSVGGPEQTRFRLAQCLLVARAPWLWAAGDPAAIARELSHELEVSGWTPDDIQARWANVIEHWRRLTMGGQALGEFESALTVLGPQDLRAAVSSSNTSIGAGELCWQGNLGFCVVLGPRGREDVEVLSLTRSGEKPVVLRRPLVLPLDRLLEVTPIEHEHREQVRALVKEWLLAQ